MNWSILKIKTEPMNKINYQKELEKILDDVSGKKLLLHSCCAPCSSYCLLYLMPYFEITCFYYNPNITDMDEYEKRYAELVRLADALNSEYEGKNVDGRVYNHVSVIEGDRDQELFLRNVSDGDLAGCPEGGKRCEMCFTMRLTKAYEAACAKGFDYFTTTLTISPLKDAQLINSIGYGIAKGDGAMWLPSDFKKKGGYARSVELSAKYDLYRQNYCGCIYSKARI